MEAKVRFDFSTRSKKESKEGCEDLDKYPTRDEIKDFIANEYARKTSATSKICRTIVFAMAAAIWALFQKDGAFEFEEEPLRGLFFLSLYLLIDVCQYFIHAVAYGVFYFRITDDSKPARMIETIRNLDRFSLYLFTLKVVYLIFVVIEFARSIFSMVTSVNI